MQTAYNKTPLSTIVTSSLPDPFDFSDIVCPFPAGRYLVSLNTVIQGENKCLNDRDSYGTVSGSKIMHMDIIPYSRTIGSWIISSIYIKLIAFSKSSFTGNFD